eukprot:10232574-Lingulodinium_polyedra.AAC.1
MRACAQARARAPKGPGPASARVEHGGRAARGGGVRSAKREASCAGPFGEKAARRSGVSEVARWRHFMKYVVRG